MKGTTTLTVTVTHYQHDQHFNVKRQSVLIYIFFSLNNSSTIQNINCPESLMAHRPNNHNF
eukprot:jgi/Botrbrau1/4571/Bobra.60_2s0057.1